MGTDRPKNELPQWLWLWCVILLFISQFLARLVSPEFAALYLEGETGMMENLTVILLVVALCFWIYILANRQQLPSPWLGAWCLVLGLGCLYFAGEEASWGQHWIGWATPDGFKELNDQEETNLHNMSSWLDQKPRTLLEIAAIVGGVILPIYWRLKDKVPDALSWQGFFWPTWVCLPVSLVIGFVKLPDRLFGAENIPFPFNLNVSETQEIFVALAFLIYFASIAARVRQQKMN